MTSTLYYENPELREFEATILAVQPAADHEEIVLDRTAFYPEGGGQPGDRGVLGDVEVVDVRKTDAGIAHFVRPGSGLSPGSKVSGRLDWAHRREFMQQHSGQHVLSGALMAVGGYETVSVHQGNEYTTIEVNASAIPQTDLDEVERRANGIIEGDLPVTAEVVHESNIHTVPLRRPPKVSGDIRVVRVGEVDCVACGGVHVSRTAEIRLIRLFAVETIRGNLRLAWKIGDRAIEHYQATSSIVAALVDQLSARPEEIAGRVTQQEERLRAAEAQIKRSRQREYELIARSLTADVEPNRGQRVVTAEFSDEAPDFLRGLTELLIQQTGLVVALTNTAAERLYWSVGTGPGARFQFPEVISELLPLIEGKGGGKPPIWQGVGTAGSDPGRFLAEFKRRADAS